MVKNLLTPIIDIWSSCNGMYCNMGHTRNPWPQTILWKYPVFFLLAIKKVQELNRSIRAGAWFGAAAHGSGKNLVRTGRQRKGVAGGGLLGFMRGRRWWGLFFFRFYLVVDDFKLRKKERKSLQRGRGRIWSC